MHVRADVKKTISSALGKKVVVLLMAVAQVYLRAMFTFVFVIDCIPVVSLYAQTFTGLITTKNILLDVILDLGKNKK